MLLEAIILTLLAGTAITYLLFRGVMKMDPGGPAIVQLSELIRRCSMVFIKREYKVMIVFIVAIFAVLVFTPGMGIIGAVSFAFGALVSGGCGIIGMHAATRANGRVANACKDNVSGAMGMAFSGGAVMALCIVITGVAGVLITYYAFNSAQALFGFGFGASLVALFARVGGGIFTKAADVGADLVGKVEKRIPEDDPRNPAVVADNVGDNVGGIAGMGSDVFESYVESMIGAITIGLLTFAVGMHFIAAMFPLAISAAGILASLAGIAFVKFGGGSKEKRLDRGVFLAAFLLAVLSYFISVQMFGAGGLSMFYCIITGIAAGIVISVATEYYTSVEHSPARHISEKAQTGAATVIIEGLAAGMMSIMLPILAVSAAVLISYWLGGLYGIAIASVGMLSLVGIVLSTDTYGPIVDNAAGITEMTKMGKKVRENAEGLDAIGNTTAAINKGFAIGSAAFTVIVLFAAYTQVMGIKVINIMDPAVVAGLFIGGMLPFIISAFGLRAVGRSAFDIVNEIRRQFKNPAIMKGTKAPDYDKCITICTNSALKGMLPSGIIAIAAPLVVGFLIGKAALGGMLAGAMVTAFALALMMANAGGAWDNAKKYIETGKYGGKGSDVHANAVVGDTVGDPFKDTAGPSLNILIKLMSVVALVFLPLFM